MSSFRHPDDPRAEDFDSFVHNKNFASGQGYPRCTHRGIYARPRTPAQRAAAKFQCLYNNASIGEFTPL